MEMISPLIMHELIDCDIAAFNKPAIHEEEFDYYNFYIWSNSCLLHACMHGLSHKQVSVCIHSIHDRLLFMHN